MGENSNYKRPLNRLNAVILLEKLVRNLWMLHTNGIKWNQIEPEQKCQTEVITVPMKLAKCVLAFPFRLYLLIRKILKTTLSFHMQIVESSFVQLPLYSCVSHLVISFHQCLFKNPEISDENVILDRSV